MTDPAPNIHVGPGLPVLLAVLFVGLKLTHQIAWSWVWVLAPLWGMVVLWVGLFVGIVMYVGRNP